MSFETRLASVFLGLRAEALTNNSNSGEVAVPTDEAIIAASKQYRTIISDYASELLPIWHAIELLVLRAHSPSGKASSVTWYEFGIALSSFYKKYFYNNNRDHADHSNDRVRMMIARDYNELGLEAYPVDLRSAKYYTMHWNRWRRFAAGQTSEQDLRAVLGGVEYDEIVEKYGLDWLEQVILALNFYDEKMSAGNWESLFSFVDGCSMSSTAPLLTLVRHVFSGKLVSCIAALTEEYPGDAIWFCSHIMDLLYFNTASWLDPGLELEAPLNAYFVEKYADALCELAEDQESFFLALEYFCCYSKTQKVIHLLRNVGVSDPKFPRCLDIVNSVFPGDDSALREEMYEKMVKSSLHVPQRALLIALEASIPKLVDMACKEILSHHGLSPRGLIAVEIEPELIDSTSFPLLQLILDYNEFTALYASGSQQQASCLLSKIIIHRQIPSSFLPLLLSDCINYGLLEGRGPKLLSIDAMYKLLEDLDKAPDSGGDKKIGRMALLRGISQCL